MTTKDQIIKCGLVLAADRGIESVSHQSVADALGTYRQLVAGHFPTVEDLRAEVEAAAIVYRVIPVVAQAITGPRSARYVVTADTLQAVSKWIEGRGNVSN